MVDKMVNYSLLSFWDAQANFSLVLKWQVKDVAVLKENGDAPSKEIFVVAV